MMTLWMMTGMSRDEDEVSQAEVELCSSYLANHFPEGQFYSTSHPLGDLLLH
jgi:hypothetical protein